jgi:release factor glutamine methyltransferase
MADARTKETWTILKVLQSTVEFFERKGIDQPRPTAEVLLAYALGTDRLRLYLDFERPLTEPERARCREAVRRRAKREPTQHITGHQEFWSLDFQVSPEVLVPRPETERLVETALEKLGEGRCRVLDVGTGSGAIAVALAHERPKWQLVATDLSEAALRMARGNAERNGVADRIRFAAMDRFAGLSPESARFDAVVSNPPYVAEAEWEHLAPEVTGFEPEGALRGGGADGLDTVRALIREAPRHLLPGGSLLLEIGWKQADLLRSELESGGNFEYVGFIRDYSGIERIVHLRRCR